jgi:hypothetical protein
MNDKEKSVIDRFIDALSEKVSQRRSRDVEDRITRTHRSPDATASRKAKLSRRPRATALSAAGSARGGSRSL